MTLMHNQGFFKDLETNEYAEPHAYYSDGIGLRPTYFPYYLRKHSNYNLDVDFVTYLIDKKFSIADLLPDTKDKLERELIEKIK